MIWNPEINRFNGRGCWVLAQRGCLIDIPAKKNGSWRILVWCSNRVFKSTRTPVRKKSTQTSKWILGNDLLCHHNGSCDLTTMMQCFKHGTALRSCRARSCAQNTMADTSRTTICQLSYGKHVKALSRCTYTWYAARTVRGAWKPTWLQSRENGFSHHFDRCIQIS